MAPTVEMALPRRRRRGQAAVLVAMVLFSVVLFLALATNMGILVNDRIRMQNTADLATYATAYAEARVLNELTHINTQIANTVSGCRAGLLGGSPWHIPCYCQSTHPVAEAQIVACKIALDALISQFVWRAQYTGSVSPAMSVGRATAEANMPGTSGRVSFMQNIPGSPTFPGTYNISFNTNYMGLAGSLPAIGDYTQSTVKLNYLNIITCPCQAGCCFAGISYPDESVHAWFRKENADPEIWVEGRVYGTPKKQYLDIAYGSGDGGFFGASSTGGTDLLYAYAVAKPYEGSVGPTRVSNPDADWTIAGIYSPGPGSMWVDVENDLGMVEEYRARLAGMREDLAGTSPLDLAFMDGAINLGRMWNTGYFMH